MLAGTASADPDRPAKVTIELTDFQLSFPAGAVSMEDVVIPLIAKQADVDACLDRKSARVLASGIAVMTVNRRGTIVGVDAVGDFNAAAMACLRKYRGVRIGVAVGGAFSLRVTVDAVEEPEKEYVGITRYPPHQKHGIGGARPVEVEVAIPTQPTTARADVDRLIKASSRLFLACFQRELNRNPKIASGGKLVVRFTIGADGRVTRVVVTRAFDGAVDACVTRVILGLTFPRGAAVVTYPFVFQKN
jgi:hypothetical protein